MHNTHLPPNRLVADSLIRLWRREDEAGVDDGALVLRLMGIIHPVLEQMEGHAEGFEAELFSETELPETEEVFV